MDGPSGGTDHRAAGQRSLAAGIVALLAAFVPVIGDLIALPAAALALAFGAIGIRHFDQGRSARIGPAALGTTFATVAVIGLAIVGVATR